MTTGFDPNAGKTSGIITSSTPSPLVGPIPVGTQRPTASAAITKATESDLIKEYGRKSDAQRKALAAKLKAAGYKVPVTGAYSSEVRDAFIAANTALSDEITTLQQSDPSRLAEISYDLDSYLDNIAAQKTGAAGGGPQVTAYPEITNEQDGRITINKFFQDKFGRDATDAEFKAAYNDIIKQQKAKPRKQTITRNAKGEKVISYTGGTNTEQILSDWVAKKPKLQSEADTYEASDANVLKREKEKELYDRELAKLGGDPEKIAALNASTSYGRSIQSMQNKIARIALETGGQKLTDAELAQYAKEAIDTAIDTDAESLTAFINSKMKFGKNAEGRYTGVAGENVDALAKVAAANGLDLEKAFGAQLPDWLSAVNKGESIETYKKVIRDVAKIGMPEKVAKLIDQGIDLSTIYAPYKNLMASTLEISPESIDLKDPTLRSAITTDAEVPLYEFERALRRDPRWQYTKNAREDMSSTALDLLRNFGFQG